MEEKKKRRAGIMFQPAHCGFSHLGSWPLAFERTSGRIVVKIYRTVVHFKAGIQSKTAVQNEAPHKRSGPVSGVLQDSGKCYGCCLQRNTIILHAICGWVRGSEQRGV